MERTDKETTSYNETLYYNFEEDNWQLAKKMISPAHLHSFHMMRCLD